MINLAVIHLDKLCGGGSTVELDGLRVEAAVRALTLASRTGDMHTLTLEIPVYEVDVRAADVIAGVSDESRTALVALGWTPPEGH